jgi:hypothetical protein
MELSLVKPLYMHDYMRGTEKPCSFTVQGLRPNEEALVARLDFRWAFFYRSNTISGTWVLGFETETLALRALVCARAPKGEMSSSALYMRSV